MINHWLKWEELANNSEKIYTPRTGHTVSLYKNILILFGGIDEIDRQNDVWFYEIATNSWTKPNVSGESPSARSGAASIINNDNFYIFGGYTRKHGDYFNDLHYLNIVQLQWNVQLNLKVNLFSQLKINVVM